MAYYQQFVPAYRRREQQRWSLFYLCGQLSSLVRKTIEPMVLELYGVDANAVRALQHYIGAGSWAAGSIIRRCQALAAAELGEADGVVVVDGSGFPKQGNDSVGVAHQYCGALGKVANCQQGVFAAYATRRGYTFLDERLYVHESWFGDDHRERWQACGIPNGLSFHTEPELGLEMLAELVARAEVPFRWVTADERYGQNPGFLDGVAELGKWYLAEVPADTRVWLKAPPVEPPGRGPLGRPRTRPRVAQSAPSPRAVRDLCADLPAQRWTRHTIKEGAKGELVAEFAFVRATTVREELPGPCVWVVFRRSLTNPTDIKYYHSNAPATCPTSELVRVSGLRWPIETALEEAKGELGMDHYETRTWLGWHHHMAQTFMAHGFLTHLRLVFEKTIQLSPQLKLISWLPKLLPTTLHLSTWPTSLTIASVATMPPIVHTASARWRAIALGVGA
jgi:SRSO17 transposase